MQRGVAPNFAQKPHAYAIILWKFGAAHCSRQLRRLMGARCCFFYAAACAASGSATFKRLGSMRKRTRGVWSTKGPLCLTERDADALVVYAFF